MPELVDQQDGQLLLELAGKSIEHGLLEGGYLDVDLKTIPDSLLRPGASFVTLSLQGQLRGCIGHLEATQPLVQDVVENASLAAFSDPRFSPLTPGEFK
ncbi:MAG: AMMECR1 domain-containing protein, partial [Proteobacteria bacterium]|nr:AMMECR1 domain-containing protein [Pseudomonadota bacterium]